MREDIREKLKMLRQWTDTLARTAKRIVPEIRETLDGKAGIGGPATGNGSSHLPKGCPNKEALAALQLREIEEKLQEVSAIMKELKTALSK